MNEEVNASDKFSKREGVVVQNSGLWINTKYPHLAASPDGLLPDGGIIEIKCLKIFRENPILEVITQPKKFPKLPTQCFLVDGQNLHLKRYHPYYFQVQLQLLVTGAPYCAFILHSPKGDQSVERITLDTGLAENIVCYTKEFWERVLIPEYFFAASSTWLVCC